MNVRRTGRNLRVHLCAFAAVWGIAAVSCKSAPAPKQSVPPEEVAVKESPVSTSAGETGEKETALPAADFALLEKTVKNAEESRREIEDNQIEVVPAGLTDADEALAGARAVCDLGDDGSSPDDKEQAYKKAAFALGVYTGVIAAYWKQRADDARSRAFAAQKEALKLKADVAVREDFKLSTGVFNNGESNYKAGAYREAIGFFIESENMYINLCSIASEKRRLAIAALQSAEKKIEESERIAADADSVLRGEL